MHRTPPVFRDGDLEHQVRRQADERAAGAASARQNLQRHCWTMPCRWRIWEQRSVQETRVALRRKQLRKSRW
jgi:hypothetical protein